VENFYDKNKSQGEFWGKYFSSKSHIRISNVIAPVAEKNLKCNML